MEAYDYKTQQWVKGAAAVKARVAQLDSDIAFAEEIAVGKHGRNGTEWLNGQSVHVVLSLLHFERGDLLGV